MFGVDIDRLASFQGRVSVFAYCAWTWYIIPSYPSCHWKISLPLPERVQRLMFTIADAIPFLRPLTLSPAHLKSPFYVPPEGLTDFLRFRMRPMVHHIMRAITHDFTHSERLPVFPLLEQRRLCAWIEYMMWHFVSPPFFNCFPSFSVQCFDPRHLFPQRIVVTTARFRDARIAEGSNSWAAFPFYVTSEALHMLGLAKYLCEFVGYTSESPLPRGIDASILLSLIQSSARDAALRDSPLEYAEFVTTPERPFAILAHPIPITPGLSILVESFSGRPFPNSVPMGYSGEYLIPSFFLPSLNVFATRRSCYFQPESRCAVRSW